MQGGLYIVKYRDGSARDLARAGVDPGTGGDISLRIGHVADAVVLDVVGVEVLILRVVEDLEDVLEAGGLEGLVPAQYALADGCRPARRHVGVDVEGDLALGLGEDALSIGLLVTRHELPAMG